MLRRARCTPRRDRAAGRCRCRGGHGRAGNLQGVDKPFSATLPLMLHYRRIWVYGGRPLARHSGLLREESMALVRHFTVTGRRQFHGILVTLWLRR
jgi:hypothetical protein